MKIQLLSGQFGWDYIVRAENGKELYIQTDWDYPATASTFGWYHKCQTDNLVHGQTDGTVDCPVCGKTAHIMIQEAQEFLDEHIGNTVEDIGYFEEVK
jgi:hypothetical protein